MPRCPGNGVELYYERIGAGPPLLFINGTGGDLRQKPSLWDGVLAQHFEVLAYDQRGLGRSGKPDRPYTMAEYADDAAALLDEVGWERAHVLGVSFGGMVGQELALRHPDRVDRLVLACTSSGGAGGAAYPLHELQGLDETELLRRIMRLGDRRWAEGGPGRDPERFEKIVMLARGRQQAIGKDADPERAKIGARRQMEARRAHDTWSRLPEIRSPTLLCGGRFDGISPPANMERMARRIPGARLELFEGGHLFLLEDRRAFPVLIDFLKSDD
ncbi:MAG: alpha/beta fold hydrolase [bacterium]